MLIYQLFYPFVSITTRIIQNNMFKFVKPYLVMGEKNTRQTKKNNKKLKKTKGKTKKGNKKN